MKRYCQIIVSLGLALAVAGCNSEYKKTIEELDERAELLIAAVSEYNEALKTISQMASAIESGDFVTGITKIMSTTDPDKEIGYTINFVNHEPISIIYGINGKVPYIGSEKGADNRYYWTIRYDDGKTELLRDADGNPVPSMGQVPYITIRDKSWYITYDGVTYTELGPADGADADAIFKSFDLSDEDYVTFYLSDGTSFKVPTFLAYSKLIKELDETNSNVDAMQALVSAAIDGLIYIKSVYPIISDSLSGTRIELSNGKVCHIYDVKHNNVPNIVMKQDPATGVYYWAASFGDAAPRWLLDSDNLRIRAVGDSALVPVISMALDTVSGKYCWTSQLGDAAPEFITDSLGSFIPAVESADNPLFQWVDNSSPYYLLLKTFDGTVFSLPKIYSVSMETKLSMIPNTSVFVPFTVYGDEAGTTKVTILTQGGFNATLSGSRIMIDAPENFVSGESQVVVVFDVCGLGNRIVVKYVDITNPQEEVL
ncbi:MAG: hypothetical protein J5699_04265 [Bacteroidales bacterium]|nr:hypothetical protein [Bacteroidales bacterium]